jgi:hypothetical protein
MGHEQKGPTIIFTDSKSAVELLNCMKSKTNLRHIAPKVAFIRDLINKRVIELCFIRGEENVSDILTKAVAREQFLKLRKWLLEGIPAKILFDMMSNMRAVMHNKPMKRDHLFYEELNVQKDDEDSV